MKENQYEMQIKRVKNLATDIKRIQLAGKNGVPFSFSAGQFVMVSLKEKPEIRRAYSIASAPNKEYIELCVKVVENGALSTLLERGKEGQTILVEGPYGKFSLQQTTDELIFIAGGTGIAPLRSMLQMTVQQQYKQKIWLIYRFKDKEHYLYQKEWEAIAKECPNIRLIPTTADPEWNGESRRPQEILKKEVADPKNKQVYICGSPEMVREVVASLLEQGYLMEQIHREMW